VPILPAFDARVMGVGPRRNIAMTFGTEKLEWCGYPMVKNFEGIFICFDRIHERDGRTDGRTPHDAIGRTCITLCTNRLTVLDYVIFRTSFCEVTGRAGKR